jgi:hypothetical protein
MRLALHRKARSSQLRAFVLSAFFVAGELQLHIAHSPVLRRARAPVIPALPVPLNVGGDTVGHAVAVWLYSLLSERPLIVQR